MKNQKVGIASLGLHFPQLAMSMEELAKLRHVDPNKFLTGLGCDKMALCPEGYNIVDLAADAAQRALSRWNGDLKDIAMIATGTESAIDMSRPLSAWVAEKLGLQGNIRSYEVKHACYGGTLAVRQAVEWLMAGVAPQKAALIIAADISLYTPGEPSEATQGAGAVALIIEKDRPLIAEIDPISYPWSKPAFDFWRPVGRAHPLVEGQFSLHCYEEATRECFQALTQGKDAAEVFNQFVAMCFHTPFPKMVKKAFFVLGRMYGWEEEVIEKMYATKVDPTMRWNRLCGNAYTAGLWIAVASILCGMPPGKAISAFSYGSGCGAELLTLKSGVLAEQAAWAKDVEMDLMKRRYLDANSYEELRKKQLHEG